MCVLVTQLCLTLCDPVDCSLPGSSVHGILQARILEWVVMPFSSVLIYVSIQITGFYAKQNVPSPGTCLSLELSSMWIFGYSGERHLKSPIQVS